VEGPGRLSHGLTVVVILRWLPSLAWSLHHTIHAFLYVDSAYWRWCLCLLEVLSADSEGKFVT
jgi:hypothetical protein